MLSVPSPPPPSPRLPSPVPSRVAYRVVIYALLYVTMILGFPVYHYATALLIAVMVRHANRGGGFFSPVGVAAIPRPVDAAAP